MKKLRVYIVEIVTEKGTKIAYVTGNADEAETFAYEFDRLLRDEDEDKKFPRAFVRKGTALYSRVSGSEAAKEFIQETV